MASSNPSGRSWRNWGDHPVFVTLSVIGILVGIVAAILAFSPRDQPAQAVNYIGRVVDSKTLLPIEGAEISLQFSGAPPIVTSDSEGYYRFSLALEPGDTDGRVFVTAKEYENYNRNITLNPSIQRVEEIRLIPVAIVPTELPATQAPTTLPATLAPTLPPASPVTIAPTSPPQRATPTAGDFSDSFDKPDGLDIGPNWAVQNGTFDIHDGQLRLTKYVDNPDEMDIALWSTPLQGADYTVQSDVTLGVTGGILLIARWQGAHHFYAAELNSVNQGVHLWKILPNETEGIELCGKGFIGGYSLNKTYVLALSVKGDQLSVFVDGEKRIECEDTSIANAGSAGVAGDQPPFDQEHIDKRWDNFTVHPN